MERPGGPLHRLQAGSPSAEDDARRLLVSTEGRSGAAVNTTFQSCPRPPVRIWAPSPRPRKAATAMYLDDNASIADGREGLPEETGGPEDIA